MSARQPFRALLDPDPRPVTIASLAIVAMGSLLAGIVCVALAVSRAPGDVSGPIGDATGAARQRAWFAARGIYGPEIAQGRHFSWTSANAELRIPGIPRSIAYRLTFTASAGRPPGVDPFPTVTVFVDGREQASVAVRNEPTPIVAELPPSTRTDARVALLVSDVFVPGPDDPRRLGIVIDRVTLQPVEGRFHSSPRLLWLTGALVACYGIALVLCGVPAPGALFIALLVAAGHAWLLRLDGAFLGDAVLRWLRIGIGVLSIGLLVRLLSAYRGTSERAPEWPIAVALVLVASAMKLAFLVHPAANVGDAVFHVHRAMAVRNGGYFFTSVTPKPYFEFPYAIALYVVAQPLWQLFPTTLDLTRLLRGLALSADALAALGFYFAVRAAWGSRRAALLAALLIPFTRLSFQSLCSANLTNVFGQGLFGTWLAYVVWHVAAGAGWIISLGVGVSLLAASFLSHFSTAVVGLPLAGALAAALPWAATRSRAGVAALLAAMVLLASITSYGLYYSRFDEVYRRTLERVAAREGEATERSMVAPPAAKLTRLMYDTRVGFGIPLLTCAVAGLAVMASMRRRDALTLAIAAAAAVWSAFSAVGVVTAIEMRASLAVQPLVVCAAAYALATVGGWRRPVGPLLAAAAVTLIIVDGLRDWIMCLTGSR